MKYLNLFSLLFFITLHSSWSQSEDDFYNLVSANVASAFSLKAANCGQQRFLIKDLYFVDQEEQPGKPKIVVNCRNFETMILPLQKLELKLRTSFKTQYHLKNLNLVIADVLKNALFEQSITTLMVPWHFDAGLSSENLKNPTITLPILLHEYGHYLIHSNYPALNLDQRVNNPMVSYFDAIHELMSDILVVVDTQDPNVMSKALQSTKLLQYPNGVPSTDIFIQEEIRSNGDGKAARLAKYLLVSRDFDDRKNDLDYILAKMKNGDKTILQGYTQAPHSLLSPVRKYLWDRVISNAEIRQKLGSAGLTKYLYNEIEKFYSHSRKFGLPRTNGAISSFEMINRELIKWLNTSLNQKFPGQRSAQ